MPRFRWIFESLWRFLRKKQELEALAAVEQQRQAAEMEAEVQLRTEQAKLNELEERVDRLEKNLDNPRQ